MIDQDAEETPEVRIGAQMGTFDFSFALRSMKDLKKVTRGLETFGIKTKNGISRIYVIRKFDTDYIWRPVQVDIMSDDWSLA